MKLTTISTLCFVAPLALILSFLASTAALAGDFDTDTGYYCPDYTATYTEGQYVVPSSGNNCHYIYTGSWNGASWYGDLYDGVVGASTIINGHLIGSTEPFNSTQNSDILSTLVEGHNYFIAIFDYNEDGAAFRSYFQTGGAPPTSHFGVLRFKYGTGASLYENYNTGDDDYGYNTPSTHWTGQSFTPVIAHQITSVRMKLYRSSGNPPGIITFSIRATNVNGLPTGSDLAVGTTDGDTLTTNQAGEWRQIFFSVGANLSAGTKYAIIFRSSSSVFFRMDSSIPSYSGGSFVESFNSGSTWSAETSLDLMFEEWGMAAIFDDITFTAPSGYLSMEPQTPYFIGHYSIANTSSWNAIRIKLSQWLDATSTAPMATYYFDTYLNYGNYQSDIISMPFVSVFGQLQNGNYNYYAEFVSKNYDTGAIISEGGYSNMPVWFWVGLSFNIPFSYPLASTTASTTPMELCSGLAPPSSVLDLAGAVQWGLCNISQWLFVPSAISVNKYWSLGTTFDQKAPFAYFYLIKTALSGLTVSATPAFSLSTSTGAIGTNIFTPLKTGLTWILWLMFGIFCIKRIAKFDF